MLPCESVTPISPTRPWSRSSRADDEDALAELYDRVGRTAYGLALRVLRDERHAEDAVQEAFLQVWRSAATFRPERAKASTWILTLVHRRAVDLVRREQRRQAEPLTDDAAGVAVEAEQTDEAAWLRFERERVQTALKRLPDLQRETLELAYYGGFSQSELAERLGVPLGTIKSRMFAGLARLRELLDESRTGRVMETGIHELTAGYALDALDPEERSAYEAHLAGCEQCRQELSSFWETTEALAVAASGPAPSPALRERILADVRAETPQNVVPLESRRRRRVVPVLAAAATIAAAAALALGLRAVDLSGQLDDTRAALEQAESAAGVLADPGAQSVELQAGDGRLVVDADGRAVLVLDGLDPAPAGKTYEMWVVPGGNIEQASPAGLFPGSAGREVVPLDVTVQSGDVVAVTVEPAGGVDAPTTQPVVASNSV